MSPDNKLGITYQSKTIWLTYLRNPSQFASPKTIALAYGRGGTHFVRDFLGITNFDNPDKRSPQAEALLAKTSETIASTNSSPERQENIEMQTIEKVEENLNNFLEASAQTDLNLHLVQKAHYHFVN